MVESGSDCHTSIAIGSWEKDTTAGGANPTRDAFAANPQFKLCLLEVDKDKFLASCNICLMQEGTNERDIAIGTF